jgi:hypothetical protein
MLACENGSAISREKDAGIGCTSAASEPVRGPPSSRWSQPVDGTTYPIRHYLSSVLAGSRQVPRQSRQRTDPCQFGNVLLSIWLLTIFSNEAAVTEIKRVLGKHCYT